jgi:asparagine synthase (glutamine-hydrolysing)
MCGIAGAVRLDGGPISFDQCLSVSRLLAHRGPNDEGFVVGDFDSGEHEALGGPSTPANVYAARLPYSPRARGVRPSAPFNLALVNRRLSIQDLSPAGHLPMGTTDRRVWLAFNGQIYNFVELRNELAGLGHRFLSTGDSEVILHAYRQWGTQCFERFNGMWALALWDTVARTLVISRDRLGIKPLYYWRTPHCLAFASEIKCLFALGAGREAHAGVIYDYLSAGALDHTDETFFRGIHRFPAASTMTLNASGSVSTTRFWDVKVESAVSLEESDAVYAERFRELFVDALAIRLRSDVPVGSCLSGGLDSSSIVSTAHRIAPRGTRSSFRHVTFSSCYDGSELDEREYVEVVAKETGVETNYIFPSAAGFWRDLDAIVWHQEEPFSGTSQYAQWCVMRCAHEHGITVLLDGQGADEQLLGYRKFLVYYVMQLLRRREWLSAMSEAMHVLWTKDILRTTNFRSGLRYSALGRRVQTSASVLRDEFRREHASRPLAFEYDGDLSARIKRDLVVVSLPALLRYEDKSSMAHSVEARLPFLDYRLVELVCALPLNQKIRRGWTKYVMRNALKGVLPEPIRLRRSKRGFATPERGWFRELGARIHSSFEESTFAPAFVDMQAVQRHFTQFTHGSGLEDSQFFCRCLLLENWGQQFIHNDPTAASTAVARVS